MADNPSEIRVLGGHSAVQFVQQASTDAVEAFSNENCQHLLTAVEEPVNGWKTITHTFRAKDRDYTDRLLHPLLLAQTPPIVRFRFGLVADVEQVWRPWEDYVLIAHRAEVQSDKQSGPLVTIKLVDKLWLWHAAVKSAARRGRISDTVAELWTAYGGVDSVIEATAALSQAADAELLLQCRESDWEFTMRQLVPLAANIDGVGGYRIFVQDDALRFHAPGYGAESVKTLRYASGTPGFKVLSIEDRTVELYGTAGAGRLVRSVYDPIQGLSLDAPSSGERAIALAGSRYPWDNTQYEWSHLGPNPSAEDRRNQQRYAAYQAECARIELTSEKCIDIRVGNVLNIELAGDTPELVAYGGRWLVNKAVHTLDQGSLQSAYVAVRGEYSTPLQRSAQGADELTGFTSIPGIARSIPDQVVGQAKNLDSNLVTQVQPKD